MLTVFESEMPSASRGARSRVSMFSLLLQGIVTLLMGAGLAHAAIPASERAVLLNIYAYTDGVHWEPRTGWNGSPGTECTWQGITCDASGRTVTGIDLAGVGLYGSLPSLSGLPNLQSFDVSQPVYVNSESPDAHPASMNDDTDTNYNTLFGPIPSLAGLTKLQTFAADNTEFSGNIPDLSGLTDLVSFAVTRCQLGGTIPALSGLTHLVHFDVDNNQLTGSIPALKGLSQLIYFNVEANHLTGALPDLSGLNALVTFEADGNLLTGDVPDLIGLTNLWTFYAGDLLNGHMGALVDLPNLANFGVSGLLVGNIPALVGLPKLQSFFVAGNRLTGNIPDLSGLSNLQEFDVGFNQLTGAAPAPPPSLVSAGVAKSGGAELCPNNLVLASTPPSNSDLAWNAATNLTPWSQYCAPDPTWLTSVELISSLNPSFVGQPVTFTAVVYGMNPTGMVTFSAQSDTPFNTTVTTLCDSVPLVDLVATCTVSTLPASGSTYSISAAYSGDVNNAPTNDLYVGASQFVGYPPMTLTATANPVQVGQPVDLTGAFDGGEDSDTFEFDDGQSALCSKVPARVVNGLRTGHCVTQFATPGPHSLMVNSFSNGPGADAGSLPLIVNVVAAAPFDANQFALTGSWYNPPTSGQGLEIEVYPDFNSAGAGLLFGGWFTYDAAGNQQWVTLQGNLASSHGASYALDIDLNTDGNFNAPPATNSVIDGSATLTFYDCTHAALAYKFNDGRSGTIPYVRLTSPSACSSAVPAVAPASLPANYDDVLHSGAWYDPNTAGQGLMIDVVPAQTTFFVAWYTYAPLTEGLTGLAGQRWFTLEDNNYTPGDLNLLDVPILSTSGGVFNQPSDVNDVQVGSADVMFTSCNAMTLNYTFTQGEFAGLSGTINEYAIGPVNGCR